jgi:hypothetical protein
VLAKQRIVARSSTVQCHAQRAVSGIKVGAVIRAAT